MDEHKKEGILLGIMTALFVVSWLFFGGAYFGITNPGATLPWVFIFLAFLIYAIALTVEIDRKHWFMGTLVAGLSPLPFFRPEEGGWEYVYTIAGSVILFGFLYWGAKLATEERTERITIRLRRIIPRGLGRALTGFAIAIAFFFLASPLSTIDAPIIKVPSDFLGGVVLPAAQLTGSTIPPEAADLTIDEVGALLLYIEGEDSSVLSEDIITIALQSGVDFEAQDALFQLLGNEELFDSLRSDLRYSIENTPQAVLEERRNELSNRFGVEVTENDTLGSIFGAALSQAYLQPKTLEDFSTVLPILLAVALFTTVRVAGILAMWIIILLTWIILIALRASGFVTLKTVSTEKESYQL